MAGADRVSFEIKGQQELMRRLKRMGSEVASRRMDTALRKYAEVVRDEMKATAPVRSQSSFFLTDADKQQPGTLRDSMTIQKRRDRDTGDAVYMVGPGSKAWYARFVVLGHRLRMPKRGWGRASKPGQSKEGPIRGHVPPHDFMTPAAVSAERGGMQRAAQYLERSLKRWERKRGIR